MRFFLVTIVVCALASVTAGAASSKLGAWQRYKAQHGKVYNSLEEDAARAEIFQQRLEMIERHNAQPDKTFSMSLNHLSDLTREEYKMMNGLRTQPNSTRVETSLDRLRAMLQLDDEPAPESVDWSKFPNVVGPVKNQGQCGSCWAFATVGMLEGQEHLNSTASNLTQLSEQNLIDCDVDTNDHGCSGGDLTDPINYIMLFGGLETEFDYPYRSGDGFDTYACEYERTKSFVTTRYIKGVHQLTQGDEELLKKVVAKYGPVAGGIDASQPSFQTYDSGIYYDRNCSSENLDHAILIVGYGTDEKHGDYWLVKNSWSKNWGEEGYFRLARNRNNHCGIATMPTIADVPRP